MIAQLELEEKNRLPVGNDIVEVHTTLRKVQYNLRLIDQGEVFGHQELIDLI